jgi:hypothetical protein
MSYNNSCSINPIVPLDLEDLFSWKSYGHLMGWSTLVDLGYDVVDLGYDVVDLGFNVVDLNYNVIDKAKRVWRR